MIFRTEIWVERHYEREEERGEETGGFILSTGPISKYTNTTTVSE